MLHECWEYMWPNTAKRTFRPILHVAELYDSDSEQLIIELAKRGQRPELSNYSSIDGFIMFVNQAQVQGDLRYLLL